MKSARFAEFLLRRTTGPDQAAAQIGDLLELSSTHGTFWFWRAVLGTLARGIWRSLLGALLAYWTVGWAFQLLMHPVLSVLRVQHGTASHYEVIGGALAGAGATWTMLAVHAAVRFGIRSPLAQTAALLAASVWLYLGVLWGSLPWTGLALVPILVYVLFVKSRQRVLALSLFLILPVQVAVLITTFVGFDRYIRATGSFPYPPANPMLRWLFLHNAALMSLALSLTLLALYSRWQRWSSRRSTGSPVASE